MELVLKEWGRSLGAVFPADKVKQLNLKKDDVILVRVINNKQDLTKLFGALKMKRPTAELLAESDAECWDE